MADKTVNVLLVEDNESDYIVAREMLERGTVVSRGQQVQFTPFSAKNFAAAVELLKSQRFDVILLDLSLPDAQGIDCFYSMRAMVPHVPIVVVTAYDDQQTAVEAVQAGARDYLVKSELNGGWLVRSIGYVVENNRLAAELENKKDAVERLSRTNTDFLKIMGAELRAPLESIAEHIEQALKQSPPDITQAYFKRIKASADLLESVVSNVIDFSQIEGGKIEVSTFAFKLREYLVPLMTPLEILAQVRRGSFDYEIAEAVPNTLVGDPEKLGRVLMNLVRSVIKFNNVGGKTLLRVDVDAHEADKALLHFWIKLPHALLPIEKQELIFESLAQADLSVIKKYAGTGLSFALASRFVNLMGGRIWLESDPHLGSSIQFTAQYNVVKI